MNASHFIEFRASMNPLFGQIRAIFRVLLLLLDLTPGYLGAHWMRVVFTFLSLSLSVLYIHLDDFAPLIPFIHFGGAEYKLDPV